MSAEQSTPRARDCRILFPASLARLSNRGEGVDTLVIHTSQMVRHLLAASHSPLCRRVDIAEKPWKERNGSRAKVAIVLVEEEVVDTAGGTISSSE